MILSKCLPVFALLGAFALFADRINAQPYSVVTERAEYVELTDPDHSITDTSELWRNAFYVKTDFVFPTPNSTYDLNHDLLDIYANGGFIELKNDTYGMYLGFLMDTKARTGKNQTSEFSYKLTHDVLHGKILKFQWKNVRAWNSTNNEFLNFQGWIYENGIIDIRIGSFKGDIDAFRIDSVGPQIFVREYPYSNSSVLPWCLEGTPSSPKLVNDWNRLASAPDSGTVIKFIPTSSSVTKTEPALGRMNIYESSGRLAVTSLSEPAMVTLTNILGQMVLSTSIGPSQQPDIRHLPVGAYHATVSIGGEVVALQMFVKR